jgi:hypothetical protein
MTELAYRAVSGFVYKNRAAAVLESVAMIKKVCALSTRTHARE